MREDPNERATALAEPAPSNLRLILGLVLAAGASGIAVCVFVYLVSNLLRHGSDNPTAETFAAAGPIFAYLLAFTLTLGFACAKVLVYFGSRGPLAWSMVGAVGGVIAGAAYGIAESLSVGAALLVVSGLLGWAQLLIVRRIAGMS